MPKYIDGFVIPVPKKNLKAYARLAQLGCKVWREHGALGYHECVGDDLNVPFGLPFPKGIRVKKGETVVFSFIVYKSKAHRDRVNKKVMADPRLAAGCDPNKMPFDAKRMMYGGFSSIVGF
ncbi:MAG TPA: DUF1428 domain-containing protein [Opitutaceae bacterium]|nr:DUF1428 domain-containing protein [Opitutaceae bacterium]